MTFDLTSRFNFQFKTSIKWLFDANTNISIGKIASCVKLKWKSISIDFTFMYMYLFMYFMYLCINSFTWISLLLLVSRGSSHVTHAVILPMHRLRIYNNRTIISSIDVVLGDMSLLKCQFENLIVALVGDTAAIIYATFVSILNNI